MRSPFRIFRKKSGLKEIWYVRFLDVKTGKVLKTRSTGVQCKGQKGRKIDARPIV